ncbi:MAG: hypothetical protein L3J45_08115 [Flavobacteriaceae bacterium]|nr:hypothetical protein [Flavobacteriaceae bacterium]
MYNLKHTFKQLISPLIKLLILTGSFYFIYHKLYKNDVITWAEVTNSLKLIFNEGGLLFFFILSLSACNWLLEIFKWQTLVNTSQELGFKAAAKQSLGALTVSLITPNRVGDYVAKAIYYPKNKTKKIVGLNAIGQFTQFFITLLFGLVGFIYMHLNFAFAATINFAFLGILATVITVLIFSKKGRFYSRRAKQFYTATPLSTHFKILGISLLRYLVFSHQFYLLLLIFNLQTTYISGMMAIFSMYLLASIVPSLTVLDWVVKGSAAVFVFGFLSVNTFVILEITLLMWLFNFAIPALFGSVYVLRFKTAQTI